MKSLQERFIDKIEHLTACWNWNGSTLKLGYGQMWGKEKKPILAHRVAYELFYGKIPKGLHIDHLCRNRKCVNPLHLEAVTCKENLLRGVGHTAVNAKKKKCVHSHLFDKKNTRIRKNGNRQCWTCIRKNTRASNARRKRKSL